jgi:cell division FtsZ-interacting protein ZapD
MEPLPQNSAMFEAAPEQRPDAEPIVYEQPLNERMRAFMRLEFLWHQLSYHAGVPNAWSSRAAVSGLLEILAITSRGDARGDVLKELERQMSALRDFQNRPGVDGGRLRAVLSALMRRREELNAAGANFMQKLRESEFLNAIKHRSAIPGGTCEFDLPDFYHWLSLDSDTREADLAAWIATIRPLCESISELLWITTAVACASCAGTTSTAVPYRRTRTCPSCSQSATRAPGTGGARSSLPALRHAPRMERQSLPAVLQRALQAHRPRRLAQRGERHPGGTRGDTR